ncbi:hypothetical protein BCR34DRAFT_613350 [Clohesyomyces aquaticus]|uniref:Uncharacterized protein n=1 Tax=Clohesyomyces aquaticus TaxID=1231657 RepID=A0A1Y1ZTI4_9PLEO|nr:hypothetical protein BCR34DRAFT_613350 [Clohesyomyces aquaticus]
MSSNPTSNQLYIEAQTTYALQQLLVGEVRARYSAGFRHDRFDVLHNTYKDPKDEGLSYEVFVVGYTSDLCKDWTVVFKSSDDKLRKSPNIQQALRNALEDVRKDRRVFYKKSTAKTECKTYPADLKEGETVRATINNPTIKEGLGRFMNRNTSNHTNYRSPASPYSFELERFALFRERITDQAQAVYNKESKQRHYFDVVIRRHVLDSQRINVVLINYDGPQSLTNATERCVAGAGCSDHEASRQLLALLEQQL